MALIGYSMGGYFAPRAAAFDKRIAACVADCLLPDAYTPMARTMEMDGLIESGETVRLAWSPASPPRCSTSPRPAKAS